MTQQTEVQPERPDWKMLKNELDLIQSEIVHRVVLEALQKVHPDFFTAPASTTGKHHPLFSLGEGGLVRHTKAAVLFASALMVLEHNKFSQYDKDIIIGALILHDTCKSGKNWDDEHSSHTHPLQVADLLFWEEKESDEVEVWRDICELVETHMGQWNTSNHDPKRLDKPTTRLQQFVHECDYLASRKFLQIEGLEGNLLERPEDKAAWRQELATPKQLKELQRLMKSGRFKRDESVPIRVKMMEGTLKKGEASDIIKQVKG